MTLSYFRVFQDYMTLVKMTVILLFFEKEILQKQDTIEITLLKCSCINFFKLLQIPLVFIVFQSLDFFHTENITQSFPQQT